MTTSARRTRNRNSNSRNDCLLSVHSYKFLVSFLFAALPLLLLLLGTDAFVTVQQQRQWYGMSSTSNSNIKSNNNNNKGVVTSRRHNNLLSSRSTDGDDDYSGILSTIKTTSTSTSTTTSLIEQESSVTTTTTVLSSRRSALLSAAKSASVALFALSIDPSKSYAVDDNDATLTSAAPGTTTPVITPIKASWKAVDGLNTFDEQSDSKNFVGFDGAAYQAMVNDQSRTPLFYKVMEERITKKNNDGSGSGTTVLDLGTGPFAIFAIKAAELGAKKVYAIEANKDAAVKARAAIAKKGYDDGTIEVLEGFSTDISLPNNDKVDLIVAEIIGSIATEEGVVATITDAHKRFAKNPDSPNSWIPTRVQTYAAPASYTLHNIFGPPGFDWSKLDGEPVRFNCRDEGLQLLATPQIVEDIVFSDILNYNTNNNKKKVVLNFEVDEARTKVNTVTLIKELQENKLGKSEATRQAIATGNSFSGIALWPRLILSDDDDGNNTTPVTIDSRTYPNGGHQKSHWQTVLPIMSDVPIPVRGGDTIRVNVDFEIPSGTVDIKTPATYKLDGTVVAAA